uniref:Uncharacterized protein n=1 Tax=Ditylenchus dipsaci TaxID=166011 RepID=A0A915DMG9_9BILA
MRNIDQVFWVDHSPKVKGRTPLTTATPKLLLVKRTVEIPPNPNPVGKTLQPTVLTTKKAVGHPKLMRLPRVSSPSEIELRTNGHPTNFHSATDSSERKRVASKARSGTSISDDEEVTPELTEANKAELVQLEELSKSGDHSNRLLYFAKRVYGRWLHSSTPCNQGIQSGLGGEHVGQGADLYAITKDRMSAVHVAARWANDHMLQTLIDKRMDVAKPAGHLVDGPSTRLAREPLPRLIMCPMSAAH